MMMNSENKEFFEKIYQIVRQIPKGKVTSYGAIATSIGSPRAARMVGWAMNASHFSKDYVPAHRVVNRNGVLTGKHHFPTINTMQELLEAEGVKVVNDKVQAFEKVLWIPEIKD